MDVTITYSDGPFHGYDTTILPNEGHGNARFMRTLMLLTRRKLPFVVRTYDEIGPQILLRRS